MINNNCTHQGKKTIIVTEAFAAHERTQLKCTICKELIPDDGGEVAIALLKQTFKKLSNK